jgi:signal peptidase II
MNGVPVSRYLAFLSVAALAALWDLWSKTWVFTQLGYPHRGSDWSYSTPLLWGEFRIQLFTNFNNGGLWGVGQGWAWLFAIVGVIAAGGILYVLFAQQAARSWTVNLVFALIMAGIIGNLYDRLHLHDCTDINGQPLYGVRDFIDCHIPIIAYEWGRGFKLVKDYHWPTFNFADVYLVSGAIAMSLRVLFLKDPFGAGLETETTSESAGPSSSTTATASPGTASTSAASAA